MSEEQSDKLKLNLKTTDTNRFKIEADQPTEQPAEQLPQTEAKPAQIDELEAQRKVNTGNFKRIDVTGQAPSNTTVVPGLGDGGIKKSETVRLKVVRATPSAAPAAGAAASTVKLNLKRPDEPVATPPPAASAPAPAPASEAAPAPAPSPAQTSTLKLRPTTLSEPPKETPAASTATVKVPLSAAQATPAATVAVEPPTEGKPSEATVAVEPPTAPAAEAAKPALKLNKPKKEAAATVAVEPPPEAKPAEEPKKEEAKPAMKMKGAANKEDDVEKYLPQRDDDEPGALEGVAALIAFLGTGFATYQLVMNFLQQIQ